MNKSKILCIDDNNDTCELVKVVFRYEDYETETYSSPDDGVLAAMRGKFGAIILDNRFSGTSGTKICREIRSFDYHTPIIFYSAESRPKEIEAAMAAGATEYLVKPNDFERLAETVIKLIKESNM